jgi:hypothetical protein
MAGPHTWGAIEPPHGRATDPIGAKDGEPTLSMPGRFEGAPHHAVNYDATDGRHNRERGLSGWDSVDHMSGHTSDTDFGTVTGHFEDGPGVWRQT